MSVRKAPTATCCDSLLWSTIRNGWGRQHLCERPLRPLQICMTHNVHAWRDAPQVKRGMGLNTRVGAARFITSLAMRVGPEIRPSAGALIKVRGSMVTYACKTLEHRTLYSLYPLG